MAVVFTEKTAMPNTSEAVLHAPFGFKGLNSQLLAFGTEPIKSLLLSHFFRYPPPHA
jgi:hypothetical protein